ncbi:hypothetical protein DFJ73DRAFT_804630 [Zopfochytrium polystomum]|nr:hypothetical protein DFJ73DRAFT_804630 [Zopfochytrium polystomum]
MAFAAVAAAAWPAPLPQAATTAPKAQPPRQQPLLPSSSSFLEPATREAAAAAAATPSAGARKKRHPPPLQTWLPTHDANKQQQQQNQHARQLHPMMSPPSFTASVNPAGSAPFGFLGLALADPSASYGYVDCILSSNPAQWLPYVLVLSHNVLSLLSFSAFHLGTNSESYSPTLDGPVVTLADAPEDSMLIDDATSFWLSVAPAPLTGPILFVDTNIPNNRVRWAFRCHAHHSLPTPSGLESARAVKSLESWLTVLRGKSLLSSRTRSLDAGLSTVAAGPSTLTPPGAAADLSQGRTVTTATERTSNNFWPGIREREEAPRSAGFSPGMRWLRRKKSRENLPLENLPYSNPAKTAVSTPSPRSSMETAQATRVVNPPRPPQQLLQHSVQLQSASFPQAMPPVQQLAPFSNFPPPLSAVPTFSGSRMFQNPPAIAPAGFSPASAPTASRVPSLDILPTLPIAPKADYYSSIAALMMRKYGTDPPSDHEKTVTNQPGRRPSNHHLNSSASLSTPTGSRNEAPISSLSQPPPIPRHNTAPSSLQTAAASSTPTSAAVSTDAFPKRQPTPASEVDDATLSRRGLDGDDDQLPRLTHQNEAFADLDTSSTRPPGSPLPRVRGNARATTASTPSLLSTASNRASFGSHVPAPDPDLIDAGADAFAANVREIVERRRADAFVANGREIVERRRRQREGRDVAATAGLDALVAASRGRGRDTGEEVDYKGSDRGGEGRRSQSKVRQGKERARKIDIPRRSTSLMPEGRAALRGV